MVNRVKRRVSCFPKATYYKPREVPFCDLETINLSIENLEALRLCDLLNVEQNDAAEMMGVSRKTFWNDLQKAREKVVDALVNGKAIEIYGGEYINSGEVSDRLICKGCENESKLQCYEGRPTICPKYGSGILYRRQQWKGKKVFKNNYCCPKNKGKTR